MPDRSLYKVGVVLSVEECPSGKSKGTGKTLRSCQVDIGDSDASQPSTITVVTAASNVRQSSRIVVAPVGSTVIDDSGEEMEVKKVSVGGVMSEGMFCDSPMLGWKGGAVGVAATVPEEFAVGSAPPAQKPRPKGVPGGDSAEGEAKELPGLFEKKVKLTKEEKKRQAEERKARLKAKKAAKAAAEADADGGDEE